MIQNNDTNQITIRITRAVKNEATGFGDASLYLYTLLLNLDYDALRNWLLILEKKYGGQKNQ